MKTFYFSILSLDLPLFLRMSLIGNHRQRAQFGLNMQWNYFWKYRYLESKLSIWHNRSKSFTMQPESTNRGISGSRILRKVLPNEECFAQKPLLRVPKLSEKKVPQLLLCKQAMIISNIKLYQFVPFFINWLLCEVEIYKS